MNLSFDEGKGSHRPLSAEADRGGTALQGQNRLDGLVSGYNISFGGGIKRMLNEEHKEAKEAFGIITSLPFEGEEPTPAEKDEDEAVIVTYDRSGKAHETRIGGKAEPSFALRLTQM